MPQQSAISVQNATGITIPTPQIQTTVSNTNNTGGSKLKIFIIVLVILAIVSVLGSASYATYYFYNQAKIDLKANSNTQSNNLGNLRSKYSNIVEQLQQTEQSDSSSNQGAFLKVNRNIKFGQKSSQTQVLGIESDPTIQTQRQFLESVKDAKSVDDQILAQNNIISGLSSNFFSRFLPSSNTLVDKTNKMATKSQDILSFYEKESELNIKLFTSAYQLGVAFASAIEAGGGPESVQASQEQLTTLEGLYNNYQQLATDDLPQPLKDYHRKNLESFKQMLQSFKDANNAIIAKNAQALVNAFEVFNDDSTKAQSDAFQVETVSFWQNDETIRSVESIQTEWQNFANSL